VKIVFWGTPKYAADNLVDIVNAGNEVIAVVTQPDRKRGRGKTFSPSPVKKAALDFGIPVYTSKSISKDQITKEILSNLNADIYVVVAFGQILPKEILDQPKLGCWNSHASLLPVWRGAAPIQWSILNDDRETGICIMAMDEGLDTGPVIEQESTAIKDTDNLEILTNRLSKISSRLLVKSLENIKDTIGLDGTERLKSLKAISQSKLKGNPSYARQIIKEDYLIDWNQNARIIFKKIQGLYPNAYTFHKGKRIKLLEISLNVKQDKTNDKKIFNGKSFMKSVPGEVIMLNKQNGITVMTNNYPIFITFGQLEGKNRTDGHTLSVQANININDILGN
tara:strand:+ start:119 stop:1129 length:1011 start_codon:yes stop_codon:yes gene_type:complete